MVFGISRLFLELSSFEDLEGQISTEQIRSIMNTIESKFYARSEKDIEDWIPTLFEIIKDETNYDFEENQNHREQIYINPLSFTG